MWKYFFIHFFRIDFFMIISNHRAVDISSIENYFAYRKLKESVGKFFGLLWRKTQFIEYHRILRLQVLEKITSHRKEANLEIVCGETLFPSEEFYSGVGYRQILELNLL